MLASYVGRVKTSFEDTDMYVRFWSCIEGMQIVKRTGIVLRSCLCPDNSPVIEYVFEMSYSQKMLNIQYGYCDLCISRHDWGSSK